MEATVLRPSEAELVSRLAAGDVEALAPLYRRYGGEVRSLLVRIEPALGHEGADDVCQEVFLTFYETIGRYEERGRLRSWLFGIAVRKARGWRRRTWLRRALRLQHGDGAAAVALGQTDLDAQLDARRRLDRLIRQMPANWREVVVLRVIEGHSARQTAAILGISENAVATRLHRARRMLKGEA